MPFLRCLFIDSLMIYITAFLKKVYKVNIYIIYYIYNIYIYILYIYYIYIYIYYVLYIYIQYETLENVVFSYFTNLIKDH